jgi:hypothetical protein
MMLTAYKGFNPGERPGFTPSVADALVAGGVAIYVNKSDRPECRAAAQQPADAKQKR